MSTSTYYAVTAQNAGTCSALNWAWISVAPMVLARGSDARAVLEQAYALAGEDDVRIWDTSAGEWVAFDDGREVQS